MAKQPIRDVREIWPISGVGGFMEVSWHVDVDSVDPYAPPPKLKGFGPIERLEVQRWELTHKLNRVTLPLSGGKGALSKRRVSDDFTFVCEVLMNMKAAKGKQTGSPFTRTPFLNGMLQGEASDKSLFHIAIKFQVGDPSFWYHPEIQPLPAVSDQHGLWYSCDRVLITEVVPTVAPQSVVAVVVRGEGSTPLRQRVDGRSVGFGGLGF